MEYVEQYAYTGDKKLLIPSGYEFRKAFAANYKTYSRDNVVMYVISKMRLEMTNLPYEQQVKYVEFILENKHQPDEFWISGYKGPGFNRPGYLLTQFGNIVTYREWLKLRDECVRFQSTPSSRDGYGGKNDNWDEVEKLEGGRDGYVIGPNRAITIIQLDNLHPLERI